MPWRMACKSCIHCGAVASLDVPLLLSTLCVDPDHLRNLSSCEGHPELLLEISGLVCGDSGSPLSLLSSAHVQNLGWEFWIGWGACCEVRVP